MIVHLTKPGRQSCRLEDAILLNSFGGCTIVPHLPPRHIELPAPQFGRSRAHGCDILPLLRRQGTRATLHHFVVRRRFRQLPDVHQGISVGFMEAAHKHGIRKRDMQSSAGERAAWSLELLVRSRRNCQRHRPGSALVREGQMQRGSRERGKRLIELKLKERTVAGFGKGLLARPAHLLGANADVKRTIRGGISIRHKHSDSIDRRLGEGRRHRNDSLSGLTGQEN